MRALALFLLPLLASCSFVEPCGPNNCTGCCSEDGQCNAGVSTEACGAGGAQCLVCSVTEICPASVCTMPAPGSVPDGGTAQPDGGAGTREDGGAYAPGDSDGGTAEVPDAGCTGPACTCTPGTSRSCYPFGQGLSDPTVARGTCHSGTQTCTTVTQLWSACTGAVIPLAERCDGLDNDCDGTLDEGCPAAINFRPSTSSPAWGTKQNLGNAFLYTCPDGEAVTEVKVTSVPNFQIYALRFTCGTTTVRVSKGSPLHTYDIAVGPGGSLPMLGWLTPPGAQTKGFSCPADSVVSAVFGLADTAVNGLGVRCSHLAVTSTDVVTTLVASSVRMGVTLGAAFNYDCPGNGVVIGVYGRANAWIDQLGVLCSTLDVTPRL